MVIIRDESAPGAHSDRPYPEQEEELLDQWRQCVSGSIRAGAPPTEIQKLFEQYLLFDEPPDTEKDDSRTDRNPDFFSSSIEVEPSDSDLPSWVLLLFGLGSRAERRRAVPGIWARGEIRSYLLDQLWQKSHIRAVIDLYEKESARRVESIRLASEEHTSDEREVAGKFYWRTCDHLHRGHRVLDRVTSHHSQESISFHHLRVQPSPQRDRLA